jgi:hypothetical protein
MTTVVVIMSAGSLKIWMISSFASRKLMELQTPRWETVCMQVMGVADGLTKRTLKGVQLSLASRDLLMGRRADGKRRSDVKQRTLDQIVVATGARGGGS